MVLTMADAKVEQMDGKTVERSAVKTDDAKAAWMVATKAHSRAFWMVGWRVESTDALTATKWADRTVDK
jgi:hypothetical protein